MIQNENKRFFTPELVSGENLETASELGCICLFQVDREGRIAKVLDTAVDQQRSTQVQSIFELVPDGQKAELSEKLCIAFDNATPGKIQYSRYEPDGRERIQEIRITGPEPGATPDTCLVAVLDVTDMVAPIRQSRERHEALLSLFETLPDTYFRVSSDGTILDYLAQNSSDLYLSPDHFLGKRIQEILPRHVSRLWEENLQRLRAGEQNVSYEYELDLATGKQVFESRLGALPRSSDVIAIVRNITARRIAEAQLLESTHRLEEAQSIAHIGSFTFDISTGIASWTPETYRIFGVDSEVFVPTLDSVERCMHPEDREPYRKQIETWLSGIDEPIDLRIQRPDGVERILCSRCKAIYDENGQLTDLAGTVQDVTEQRQIDRALKSSEERFRHMIEMSWDMIVLLDTESRVTYVNRAVEMILGYSPDSFVGMVALELIHPEDLEFARSILAGLIENPDKPSILELRMRHRSGGWCWVDAIARNLFETAGVAAIVANVRDVTDRKQAEAQLHAQEQRFRALIENSADAIALVTKHRTITYVSNNNALILGCAVDELLGLGLLEFIVPEARQSLEQTFSNALAKPGIPVAVDTEAQRYDGKRIRLEGHFTNLIDLEGVKAVVFNYRNVTERELQREALERAHREADMFRRMVDLATQAIGTADLQANVMYQNPALLRLLGIPSLEAAKQYTYEDFYRDEDLDNLRQNVIPTVLREGHWIGEMTLQPLGGGVVPTIHNVYVVRDDAGMPVMFSNVVTDISQQKGIEEALRISESKYRQLFEEALDGIAVADLTTGELLDANPALCRMVGRSREELIGQPQRILHHPEETIGEVSSSFEAHRSGNHGEIRESQLITSSGQTIDVEIVANVVELEGTKALQAVFRNVMDQKRAEQALRTSEAKYRQLFEEALDGIALADKESGVLLDCNPTLCRMIGRSREELIGQSQRILHPPGELEGEVTHAFEEHRSRDPGKIETSQLLTNTGELLDVEIIANDIELEGRKVLQGVFRDVTEKKRAEEALFQEKERAQVTLHSIGDAVITTDDVCRVDYLNPVAEKLTGWSSNEAYGRQLDEIFRIHDEDTGAPLDNLVAHCMRQGKVIDVTRNTVLHGRDGKQYDIDESAAPIRRSDGRILGAVLVFHDVSETRQLTRKMAYDAAHDPLTGLINRREFEIRLGNALESAKTFGSQHALCYIDLDQFKIVNDTAGHEAGDLLLRHIKDLLSSTFREHDTLARLGGDEFGLLLDNCPVKRAESIACSIINKIREYRFVWQERGYQIGASIGLAPITSNTLNVARLLSHADVACYTAKEMGRNRVHVYHEKEGASVQRHVEILQAAGLRDAMEKKRFRLYCQPIIPLHGDEHESVSYEVLLRLQDDAGKLVMPGAFIPAAERFDLMTDLDRWVIRTAFQNYRDTLGEPSARISINLSGNSLNDPSLLDYVRRQFDEYSLPPDKVCFEITETAAVNDLSRAGIFMSALQDFGSQLALDDFGSGLSSLRYLKNLPVDFLKIDGNFIENLDEDEGDQAIVSAINQLAHQLGIRTIGEYAANPRIVQILRELGVDYAQGFAVGMPTSYTRKGIASCLNEELTSGRSN